MGDIIGRDEEFLGPFGLPTAIRWGFPSGPLMVGYVWQSTIPGHAPALDDQMEAVKACHKIFHDKITVRSGKVSPRVQWKEMLNFIRRDDTVVVHDFSCLGTSAEEVIGRIIHLLMVFKCELSIPERIDTTDPDIFRTLLVICDGLNRAGIHGGFCANKLHKRALVTAD